MARRALILRASVPPASLGHPTGCVLAVPAKITAKLAALSWTNAAVSRGIMAEKLKSCPFCGVKAYSRLVADRPSYGVVECGGCGAEVQGLSEAEAVEQWNTRADAEKMKALVEALEPFAREADDWPDKMDCEDLPADATDIKIADLRRARTALRNISGGDDEG